MQAPTLFRSLDRVRPQPICVYPFDLGTPGDNRLNEGDAQFRCLLGDEIHTVALGECNQQPNIGHHTLRPDFLVDLKRTGFFLQDSDARRPFAVSPVEKRNRTTVAKTR